MCHPKYSADSTEHKVLYFVNVGLLCLGVLGFIVCKVWGGKYLDATVDICVKCIAAFRSVHLVSHILITIGATGLIAMGTRGNKMRHFYILVLLGVFIFAAYVTALGAVAIHKGVAATLAKSWNEMVEKQPDQICKLQGQFQCVGWTHHCAATRSLPPTMFPASECAQCPRDYAGFKSPIFSKATCAEALSQHKGQVIGALLGCGVSVALLSLALIVFTCLVNFGKKEVKTTEETEPLLVQ